MTDRDLLERRQMERRKLISRCLADWQECGRREARRRNDRIARWMDIYAGARVRLEMPLVER